MKTPRKEHKCSDCGRPVYQGVLCAECWAKRQPKAPERRTVELIPDPYTLMIALSRLR